MDRKKLKELRNEIEALRRKQAKSSELQALAGRLGMKRVNRGKEPTFASDELPDARPLTIPGHKGRDLAPGTKKSILNQMDDLLDRWEEALIEQGHGNGNGRIIGED